MVRPKFAKRIPKNQHGLLADFQRDPSKSVKELAEAIGVPVLLVDMPDGKTAYLSETAGFESESEYVIYVNKRCSKDEMRWAVAHELGHFFLHRGTRGPFDEHFNLQSDRYQYFTHEKEEFEADGFAEDLFLSQARVLLLDQVGISTAEEIARATAIPRFRVRERLRFLEGRRRNQRT